MSTPQDMAECEARDCFGMPPMAAGRDLTNAQARGASVLQIEQAQKYLVPVGVLLVLVLTANALVMGLNMSRQASIETALRKDQVAQDLRRYETDQLRVQAEVNKQLMQMITAGCKR